MVNRVLEVRLLDGGLGGMSLTETGVTSPYVKDYDALDEGAGPQCWPGRFDVANWGLNGARRDGARAGGDVIATRTGGLDMFGGRDDAAGCHCGYHDCRTAVLPSYYGRPQEALHICPA